MNPNLTSALTKEQKAAALAILKWIGSWASRDISGSEDLLPPFAKRLKTNVELFNFSPNDKLLIQYENEVNKNILLLTLKSIPANTKSWFVVETYMMLSAAGNITKSAMRIALLCCEKIGISEEAYLQIIEKAYRATGDYEEGMFDM